ncbi:phosphopantetheine-binding protein [Pseudomonas sp. rhizo25]|uniref:phosphopantetheine-binding protein n=1 Tax=Pseudomonas sp. rhizo25 TaxID=3059675 RepID=UPI00288FDF49|nr:phosphopantetheine-binding protein [Pseudomonas sp. rhizo25]MDT3233179.1 phosphopantetheine-binding protein [Pseudomonas sp. rhizo25]
MSTANDLSREDITRRVISVIEDHKEVTDKVSLQSSTSSLDLDSLSTIGIIMAIEDEFSLDIPDVEVEQLRTIEQLIDYISAATQAL